MVWYSEIPARRARQILGDLWLVAWTALWIWAGIRLHDLVMNLATPALTIAEGAEDLSLSIDEAGAAVAAVPLIGEAMSAPFGGMSDAALGISDAGQATADAVSLLARFLAIALVVVAVMSWAVIWVPMRVIFIRRATAARHFVDANDDLDLLALRAMARQRSVSDNGAWGAGDLQAEIQRC